MLPYMHTEVRKRPVYGVNGAQICLCLRLIVVSVGILLPKITLLYLILAGC